jgi:hypothetical protein
MASKKPKSSKPKASKPKSSSKKRTQAIEAQADTVSGDHTRMLAPKKAVTQFITFVRSCKSSTSEAGQRLTSATKSAQDAGVNIPAARIAERFVAAAFRDSIKGRVLWEDVQLYLEEYLEFDKIAPKGLFTATEVHSTKSSRKKKNGAADPVDLSEHTDATEPGAEPEADPVPLAAEGDGEHIVH